MPKRDQTPNTPSTPVLTGDQALETILNLAPGVTKKCEVLLKATDQLAKNANDKYDPDATSLDLNDTTTYLADGIAAANGLREAMTNGPLDIDEIKTANTGITQLCNKIAERQ